MAHQYRHCDVIDLYKVSQKATWAQIIVKSVSYYLNLYKKTDVLTEMTWQGNAPVSCGVNLPFPSTLSSLVKGQGELG